VLRESAQAYACGNRLSIKIAQRSNGKKLNFKANKKQTQKAEDLAITRREQFQS
jgi:hypothetical protein